MKPSCTILAQAAAIPEGKMRGGKEEKTGDSWEEDRIERKKGCGGGEGGEKGWVVKRGQEGEGGKEERMGRGTEEVHMLTTQHGHCMKRVLCGLGGDMLNLSMDLTSKYLNDVQSPILVVKRLELIIQKYWLVEFIGRLSIDAAIHRPCLPGGSLTLCNHWVLARDATLYTLVHRKVEGVGGPCSRGNHTHAPEEIPWLLSLSNAYQGMKHTAIAGIGVWLQCHHTGLSTGSGSALTTSTLHRHIQYSRNSSKSKEKAIPVRTANTIRYKHWAL